MVLIKQFKNRLLVQGNFLGNGAFRFLVGLTLRFIDFFFTARWALTAIMACSSLITSRMAGGLYSMHSLAINVNRQQPHQSQGSRPVSSFFTRPAVHHHIDLGAIIDLYILNKRLLHITWHSNHKPSAPSIIQCVSNHNHPFDLLLCVRHQPLVY